jgi:hypothetical protein
LPGWKQRFYGKNYDKLLEIKQKYDPDMLFWCSPCVGADKMVVKDGRLCKTDSAVVNESVAVPPDADNQNTTPYAPEAPSYPLLYAGKGVPPVSLPKVIIGDRPAGKGTGMRPSSV